MFFFVMIDDCFLHLHGFWDLEQYVNFANIKDMDFEGRLERLKYATQRYLFGEKRLFQKIDCLS